MSLFSFFLFFSSPPPFHHLQLATLIANHNKHFQQSSPITLSKVRYAPWGCALLQEAANKRFCGHVCWVVIFSVMSVFLSNLFPAFLLIPFLQTRAWGVRRDQKKSERERSRNFICYFAINSYFIFLLCRPPPLFFAIVDLLRFADMTATAVTKWEIPVKT